MWMIRGVSTWIVLAMMCGVWGQVRYPASCDAPDTRAISDNFCLHDGDGGRFVYTRVAYVSITPPDAFDAIAFSSSVVVPGGRTLLLDASVFSSTDRPMVTFEGNVTVHGGAALAALGASWVVVRGRLDLMPDALLAVEAMRSPHERRIVADRLEASARAQLYAITREGENAQYARFASSAGPAMLHKGSRRYPWAYAGNVTRFEARQAERDAECVGVASDGSELVVGLAPGLACPVRAEPSPSPSPPPAPTTTPPPPPPPSPPPPQPEPTATEQAPSPQQPTQQTPTPTSTEDSQENGDGGGVGTATIFLIILIIIIAVVALGLLISHLCGGCNNAIATAAEKVDEMNAQMNSFVDHVTQSGLFQSMSNAVEDYAPMHEVGDDNFEQSSGGSGEDTSKVALDSDSGERGVSSNDDDATSLYELGEDNEFYHRDDQPFEVSSGSY